MTIERAAATADDTLDATSDTLIDGMTLTPASDDYLAVFTCTFLTTSTPGLNDNLFSVYVGGVQVDHSERNYEEDPSIENAQLPMVCSCKVSPNGSQAIEIRHRATDSASPLVAQKRELNLFPMPAAGTDYQQTDTADHTISGTSFVLLNNMTVTPVADDYLLVFSTSGTGATDGILNYKITVGGTDVTASLRLLEMENSWPNADFAIFIAGKISPNGSQVVQIEWARSGGGGNIISHQRTMNLIPFDAGDIFEATGTADDTDSTTTDKQIDDMLISAPGADDYLVLFSASDFYGAIGNDAAETQYSIQNGGSRVTDSERVHEHEGSIDNADIPVMAGGKVTVASGTDDLQMFWQNVTSTSTRTIKERTLVAVREVSAGQTVNIGLVTETDLAQAIVVEKALSLGLVTETDLAQTISIEKRRAIGLVTEIDLAQPVDVEPLRRLINQALEVDLAQAITVAKARAIGLVTETDLAQAITVAKARAIGLVTETDLAQAITVDKALILGLVSEINLAQAITVGAAQVIAIGLVLETDLAQPVDVEPLRRLISQALETDLAQGITVAKARAIGLVTETDLAQAIAIDKRKAIGLVTETDLAQAITVERAYTLGLATETDLAQAITVERAYTLGLVTETDLAQAITHVRTYTLGLAIEIDVALALITGPPSLPGLEYSALENHLHYEAVARLFHYTAKIRRIHYDVTDED